MKVVEKVPGFLALPRGAVRHPAIIVIHEWWGLTEWVKERALKLAASGYIALAVDLYGDKVTTDPLVARKLRRQLRPDHALDELKAAFDYLAGRAEVDLGHICSIGWSMGGGFAIQFVIHEPRLAACVVNYGPLPTEIADIQKIDVPILGIFGSLDRGVSPDKVRGFEACMRAAGKQVEIRIYDGARHGFENPTDRMNYRPVAAADAWFRTLKFLGRPE
ncbi:MAG: dienelactone hydrolase family protein [Devosia sp.]